jgi:hypothetical protein
VFVGIYNFRLYDKKLIQNVIKSYDVATLVARSANEAMVAESAFGGSLESGGRFCVGAFGRNLASVAVKIFSHLIYLIKKFY